MATCDLGNSDVSGGVACALACLRSLETDPAVPLDCWSGPWGNLTPWINLQSEFFRVGGVLYHGDCALRSGSHHDKNIVIQTGGETAAL